MWHMVDFSFLGSQLFVTSINIYNVRLNLSTNGFDPFGHLNVYSWWLVIVISYNFLSWMCNTQPFIFLIILILVLHIPKKEIEIMVLRLVMLWKKQNFIMRTALLWAISDFPAYLMLLSWSTNGKLAWPYCMGNNKKVYPKNSRKTCLFDCHCWFLSTNNQYQWQKDNFSRRVEEDIAIECLMVTCPFNVMCNHLFFKTCRCKSTTRNTFLLVQSA